MCSVRNPLINKCSLLLFYVPRLCTGHRCVNYWNSVFFSLLLRDRLQEWAEIRFLLYVRGEKTHTHTHTKVSNLREPGNHQIDVGAGQWLSHGRSGPAQAAQKKRAFTANTLPAPVRVSSNYPRPVLSHKPEYYLKEMVFREQWTGTVWRNFFLFHSSID